MVKHFEYVFSLLLREAVDGVIGRCAQRKPTNYVNAHYYSVNFRCLTQHNISVRVIIGKKSSHTFGSGAPSV